MRLIYEPTADQSMRAPDCQHPKVVIEIPSDDLDIDDMVNLIQNLLLGVGYPPRLVSDIIIHDRNEENE